jgi:hypothetical protein
MTIFKSTLLAATMTAMLASCGTHSESPASTPAPVDNTRIEKADTPGQKSQSMIYYCPMHPEVVSDKPGVCPKCNMDLVLKEDSVNQ